MVMRTASASEFLREEPACCDRSLRTGPRTTSQTSRLTGHGAFDFRLVAAVQRLALVSPSACTLLTSDLMVTTVLSYSTHLIPYSEI